METPQQNPFDSTDGTANDSTKSCPQDESESKSKTNAASEALAKGLSATLTTVVSDFDSKSLETLRSQDHLNSAIDRLTAELDQLLEDAPLPFIMQHAVKVSGVRKRVLSLNSVLKSIQRRIDNIDRMLSVGTLHEKMGAESSRQD